MSGTPRYYTYDAENRLTAISGGITASYTYDAFGRRIKKSASTISPDREYFYDLAGRMVIETSGASGGWWSSEYYAGGMHLGTFTNGRTYFSHHDYLGTERVKTDDSGATGQDCTYGPFGDNESCTGGINSMVRYAGYDRDSESGLDHTWFRYYNPRLGRFMTTDPYAGSMDLSNPQSMNRYAYVLGNPTNAKDPFGLNCVWDDGSYDDEDDPDTGSPEKCSKLGGTWIPGLEGWSPNANGFLQGVAETGLSLAEACNVTAWDRMGMFGTGLANLAVAGEKLADSAAVLLESEGYAAPVALYGVISASGNLTAGQMQLVGSVMPGNRAREANTASKLAAIATSAMGIRTLVKTGGDIERASQAAAWEGIFTGAFGMGATGRISLGGGYEFSMSIRDVMTASDQVCK